MSTIDLPEIEGCILCDIRNKIKIVGVNCGNYIYIYECSNCSQRFELYHHDGVTSLKKVYSIIDIKDIKNNEAKPFRSSYRAPKTKYPFHGGSKGRSFSRRS